MKLRFALSTLLIAAISLVNVTSVHAAGNATFSFSPSGGSYVKGSTIRMTISENSPVTVNSVQADVAYDASKLSYAGFSAGSFSCPIIQPGSGSVSLGCNINGDGVAGSMTVGTVSFTVLAGSGSTSIALASSSLIVHPDAATGPSDVWNHGAVGASYSFSTPAPLPPSQPGSGVVTTPAQNSAAGKSGSSASASKTGTPTTGSATSQTATTNGTSNATTGSSVLGESKNTPAAQAASLQKNTASNIGWLIVLAIVAIVAGAATIYALRHPRQVAAMKTAVLASVLPVKKTTSPTATKKAPAKKVTSKKAPGKTAKISKKS